MKNVKILLNVVLIGTCVAWLSSCDNEGEVTIVDPTANLTGTDIDQTTFEPGETIDLTLEFTAPQGIAGVNWEFFDTNTNDPVGTKEFNNPDSDPDLADITSADTQGSVDLSIPVPEAANEGQFLTLVVEVADKSSANGATAQFTFTVDAGVNEYEAVLLGGYSNADFGSFYNAIEDTVYKYQGAQDNNGKVDFLFYYANTPLYTIASPDNTSAEDTWNTQQPTLAWPFTNGVENSTRFKPLSNDFDFEGTTTGTQVRNAYPEAGTAQSRVTNLQAGQKVAFQLDESRGTRFGIFEVVATSGDFGTERAITLNVKVQSSDN
jgi:hypothetical protein